jgi:hypothetical protein
MSLLISLLSPSGGGGGGDNYRGTWDASTNTPTLPNPPTFPDYSAGDYYQVTVAGTQFGLDFTVGDFIIAVADGADLAWSKRDGGLGTVTSVGVATSNGFAGTVANPTANAVITLQTTVTGLLKGNGAVASAATPGTDYFAPGENLDLGRYSLIAGSVYLKAATPEDTSVTLHALLSDDTQIAAIEFEEDGSANFSGIALSPNFVSGAQRNESINSQTLLTFSSAFYQEFFGTDFQIVKLPDAIGLQSGHAFLFANNSSGPLDVRTTNNNQLTIIPAGGRQLYQLSNNSTSSGIWNVYTLAPENVSWGSNELELPFLSASQLVATDGDRKIQTLSTGEYPSLEEISYVKGVTSSIQDQINALSPSTYAVETPSGDIDSTNTIFTLANTPLLNTQSLYVNGLYQSIPDDYALSGDTVTFVAAPQVGDRLKITYQY